MVLNAGSGSGGAEEASTTLEGIFRAAGREVRITLAHGGEEIERACRQAVDERCDALVAGGGDGTINAAANVAVGTDVPLGVLPLGTLNHFAKDLGIPADLEPAARVVLAGRITAVDVGEVNGRIFLNNSSLGVYPSIVRLREQYQEKGTGKWIAAAWAALAVLRRRPFLSVRIETPEETVVRRTPFVFVGNNEYRMIGLQAGTRDSLTEGRLALYVMRAEGRRGLLRLGLSVFWRGADKADQLDLFRVASVSVETRRHHLQVALDGEVLDLEGPLEYRVRPGALRVLTPELSEGRDG